jgi:hypothetical protein
MVMSWDLCAQSTRYPALGPAPPVTKPKRTGFGTLLLERILGLQTNGQVVTEYAAEGLRATIVLMV